MAAPKKTPPPRKTPPPARGAVKVKRTRRAVKVKQEETPVQDIFEGLAPPGQIDTNNLQGFSPASVSEDELEALKKNNFLLWACASGIQVDHKDFDIDSHKYLIPMYMDRNKEFVLMKAAQMGATIFVLLKIFWFALNNSVKCAFFFPTQEGVNLLSKDRLTPIVHSNAQLLDAVRDTDTIGYKKIGKSSALYLRHLGGVASKDSTPFDFIAFDEVRLMPAGEIDQARERISHSIHKYVMQVSTAGYPHCFSGETEIVVKEIVSGMILPKPIKELVGCHENYEVLSYDRRGDGRPRWRKINNAICRGEKKLVKVSLWGGHDIRSTEDHRFATEDNGYSGIGIGWTSICDVPLTKEVCGPGKGVLALTEFPDYENTECGEKIVEAPIDDLTLRVLGYFIAEGTLSSSGEVQIWYSVKNQVIRKSVKDWANVNGFSYRETDYGVFAQADKKPELLILFQRCGNYPQYKVIPEQVLGGSARQLKIVWKGIIKGGSQWRSKRRSSHSNHEELYIYTSSRKLSSQLRFIGLRLGKPMSISSKKAEGVNYWQFCLSYCSESPRTEEVLPKLGKIAVDKIKKDKVGLTYDLEVDGDPWFVLAESGCLVHNSDIHRQFLFGTQNYWHTKCSCFPFDQKIVVRRIGSLIPEAMALGDLRNGYSQYEALSWNLHHKIWQYKPITKFHDNGMQNVIEATFRNGARVRVTEDHHFFQNSGKKHARTKKVAIGKLPIASTQAERQRRVSAVLIARELPDVGTHVGYQNSPNIVYQTPWDNLTLYAVGAYVAEESWKTDNWINFAKVVGNSLRNTIIKWALINNLPINENISGVDVGIGSRPDLISLFERCGKGCHLKRFPSAVTQGSKDQIRSALEGYLAGDGHQFSKNKDNRGYTNNREWSCLTTSRELRDQILFLGLRLGTPLYVTQRKKREGRKQTWELRYNPKSHFNKPHLGNLSSKGSMSTVSLRERKSVVKEVVGCITVADNENFVLADSGLLVHNCPDGVVLSDCWPDCVAITDKETYYRCPRCKTRINDPQNGRFIAHNPGAEVSSYHIHQMMSRFISPSEVWRAWQTTENIKEFYNAKLGKPYVDEENVPVSIDDLIACENPDVYWGPVRNRKPQIAMGVDQMSGINYVVIAERTPTKKRIIHYEIIDSMNPQYLVAGQRITPFKRLYTLMKDYDVDLCIIDAMPNANEAMEFARAFPKRVFVAWYLDSHGTSRDIVQWGDKSSDKTSVRRGGPKIKFKYTCVLNRFLSIDFALAEIGNRNCEWPHPDQLVQIARGLESGRYEPQPIMRNYFYLHMTKIIRQKRVIDENTGKFRMEWVNLGLDPHSIHSWNFCNIALERLRRIPLMTFA